jgi:hypothetical protein
MRRGDTIYPTRLKGKHVVTWVFLAGVLARKVLRDGALGAHEHVLLRSEIGQEQLSLLEVR